MLKTIRGPKAIDQTSSLKPELLPEGLFIKLLSIERKRTERSGRPFVLMLLDPGTLLNEGAGAAVMRALLTTFSQTTRDTDLKGWYRENSIIGVIFTELDAEADRAIIDLLSAKLTEGLACALSDSEAREIRLSFHLFPEDWNCEDHEHPLSATLKASVSGPSRKKKDLSSRNA